MECQSEKPRRRKVTDGPVMLGSALTQHVVRVDFVLDAQASKQYALSPGDRRAEQEITGTILTTLTRIGHHLKPHH
jgi:hypothetical protein